MLTSLLFLSLVKALWRNCSTMIHTTEAYVADGTPCYPYAYDLSTDEETCSSSEKDDLEPEKEEDAEEEIILRKEEKANGPTKGPTQQATVENTRQDLDSPKKSRISENNADTKSKILTLREEFEKALVAKIKSKEQFVSFDLGGGKRQWVKVSKLPPIDPPMNLEYNRQRKPGFSGNVASSSLSTSLSVSCNSHDTDFKNGEYISQPLCSFSVKAHDETREPSFKEFLVQFKKFLDDFSREGISLQRNVALKSSVEASLKKGVDLNVSSESLPNAGTARKRTHEQTSVSSLSKDVNLGGTSRNFQTFNSSCISSSLKNRATLNCESLPSLTFSNAKTTDTPSSSVSNGQITPFKSSGRQNFAKSLTPVYQNEPLIGSTLKDSTHVSMETSKERFLIIGGNENTDKSSLLLLEMNEQCRIHHDAGSTSEVFAPKHVGKTKLAKKRTLPINKPKEKRSVAQMQKFNSNSDSEPSDDQCSCSLIVNVSKGGQVKIERDCVINVLPAGSAIVHDGTIINKGIEYTLHVGGKTVMNVSFGGVKAVPPGSVVNVLAGGNAVVGVNCVVNVTNSGVTAAQMANVFSSSKGK